MRWRRATPRAALRREIVVRDKMLVAYHRVAAAWWAWEMACNAAAQGGLDDADATVRRLLREATEASTALAQAAYDAPYWPLPREAHLGASSHLPPVQQVVARAG